MKKILFLLLLCGKMVSANIVTGQPQPLDFYPGSVSEALYDFDNNGQYDLYVKIIYLGSSSYTLLLQGKNGTQIETDGSLNIIGYNETTPLGVNTYQDSGYVKAPYFPESTTKYAGFKFKINGQFCCAYMQVRCTSYYQGFFDALSFGYETNSGICITAGAAATTGIAEAEAALSSFTLTNGTNLLLINANLINAYSINVYDLTGREVYTNQNLTGTTEIATAGLPKTTLLIVATDMNDPNNRRTFKTVIL